MLRLRHAIICASVIVLATGFAHEVLPGQGDVAQSRRNVIIFVADGLRHGSVTDQDMPALSRLRAQGVDFRNSYASFPTLTMPNASAIATGRRLGDTGVFGNTVWLGHPTFDTGSFNIAPGTTVPFLESDQILGDLGDHDELNLSEDSFLAMARAHGYNTAAVGKVGPTGVQDVAILRPLGGTFRSISPTLVIDDATGTASGMPLPPNLLVLLRKSELSAEAPTRSNGYSGASPYNNGASGTLQANVVQQQWFADVATRVVLPSFEGDADKPFVLIFWSRDPDGTQHNQGDSIGTLFPGINGPTSQLAVKNVDHNLQQILTWLDEHPTIKANTDIVVTSDHGFATVSHREIAPTGRATTSESAKHVYLDANGNVEGGEGTLPYGFLSIDLALELHLNLFDPDRRVLDSGRTPYRRMRLTVGPWEHPVAGNGLIGDAVQRLDAADGKVVVAANGGSDLIYVPDGDAERVRTLVRLLLTHDYVDGVFVADKFGPLPGTLPLSAIGLAGSAAMPRPDIVVAFKVFYFNPDNLQSAVQVADTLLLEGQGVHGGIGRESTYNTMAAWGPDFKRAYVDDAPVSNSDIVPTLAHILGFTSPRGGSLPTGRVARESLVGGPAAVGSETESLVSLPQGGRQTVLHFQELDGERYVRTACLRALDSQRVPADCR